MRLTSICGLGQVALGPVMSVLRMQRERAAAGGGRDVPHRDDGRRGAQALAPRAGAVGRPVAPALGVVPGADVRAGEPLPAAARATVDGYAVRAADTYAASETLPAFLEVTGAVTMGRRRRARSARARRWRSRPAACCRTAPTRS